jgi:hypothetical protein
MQLVVRRAEKESVDSAVGFARDDVPDGEPGLLPRHGPTLLRAFRREPESRPIHGVIPRLGPAAFASGVVVEGYDERLSAVVCLKHQLVRDDRSGATHGCQSIASAREKAVVTQGVDGGFDGDDALRFGEIPDHEPRGELVPKARAEYGLMPGVSKGGCAHFAVRIAMKENKARIGQVIVCLNRTDGVQLVHDGRIDLPRFAEVGAANRPVGIVANRIERYQFLEGRLLGSGLASRTTRK